MPHSAVVSRHRADRVIAIRIGLIATTTTSAHAAAASKGFARKPDVLGNGISQGIAGRPHGVIGEMPALPRFDSGAGAGAKGEAETEQKTEGFHEMGNFGWASAEQGVDFSQKFVGVLITKAGVDVANHALLVDDK